MKHRQLNVLLMLLLLPVAGAICGWLGGPGLARADRFVQLAALLPPADAGTTAGDAAGQVRDVGAAALLAAGTDLEMLRRQAAAQTAKISRGAVWFGAFCGLVLALQLAGLARPRRREFYTAAPISCIACGRCFRYCPVEQQRLKSGQAGNTGEPPAAINPNVS